jgi:hypothetical protein
MPPREPPSDDDEEILELTPDMEVDEAEAEDADGEGEPPAEEGEAEAEGEGEDEGPPQIGFADEDEPAEGDSSVLRGLRERNRQLSREMAELRASAPAARQLELPEKPTLADCDYDEDKYEAALTDYHDTARKIDNDRAEQTKLAEAVNREWQRDLEAFNSRKAQLALPDYDDSASAVSSALSLAQQAVIIKAASDSAAFTYALGRSDARMNELAKIQDPIKLAAAVARMEGGIKVVKKRKAPAPDRPASGSGKLPGGIDKQLEKLEAEAERTGDRTAIVAHKKRLAQRGK